MRTIDRKTTPKEAWNKLKFNLFNLQITYRNIKYASGIIKIDDSPVEILNLSISNIWGLFISINKPSLERTKGNIKIITPKVKPARNLLRFSFIGLLFKK